MSALVAILDGMIGALILASSAPLAPTHIESQGSGEIVVTGERVAQPKHQTASSVALETNESIASQAVPDRVEQLLQAIPNVQLGSGGEGPTIRGQDSTGAVRDLPAFLSGTRPRTTIAIDGRSATYYELAFGLTSVWDVERVEVFRSPQTTTQGRNSIGGAIFVETQAPTFDWMGRTRLIAGNFDTRQASGVVSGPLVDDQLAFRLSGDLRRSTTASQITGLAAGIDYNRDESELLRFKLLMEPSGLPDTKASLTYSRGHSQMPQIEGISIPFEERRNPNAGYGIFAITVDALTGKLSHRLSSTLDARLTASFGAAGVRRHAPAGLGEARIDARDYSIEPIITWQPASGTRFIGGINYTRSTQDQTIGLSAFPPVQGAGSFSDVQNSLGMFLEGDVPLLSNVTLTAGVRYQYDRQVRQGALTGSVIYLPLAYDRTFTAWLPKVSVAWDIDPDVRIGLLAQLASNPGGVNLNTAWARVETFNAERLWDFELFARARLADGRLIVSANAFFYDMTNAQRSQSVTTVVPGGQVVTSGKIDNAPRAWAKGLELELDWRPTQRLQLTGGIGLLDTRITETVLSSDPMLGKRFQRSPHFSGSMSIVWRPVDALTVSGQVRHNSSYFSDDLETPERRIEGSTTVDAKASWSRNGFTLFGYVRNLFDEFHLTYLFDPAPGLATAGDPREFGLGIEASF